MLKGAALTIGILLAIAGFGWAFLTLWASSMSDAPSDNERALSNAAPAACVGVLGAGIVVVALFLP